jgi:hypothetical protein
MSKDSAQARADRIRHFREELRALEGEGVLRLPEAEEARVRNHHDVLLGELARRYDIDTSDAQKQMSWGMRIASFLAALALCAAVFLFFRRFWGLLHTPAQVAMLIAAPLVALALTELAARRERTFYVAGIAALVALGAFVLDLSMLGVIFNITPTQHAFLAWGAFGFLLAYAYGLRVLLAGGILALGGWLSATMGTWGGCYWLDFGERPENFLPAALLLLLVPRLVRHRTFTDFPPIYRIFGLLGLLLPILVLANWGTVSYLQVEAKPIETLYQIAGFVVSGAAIAWGVRAAHKEATNVGCTFFVVFLYTKFYDWWWDWMPKYLFFLILGAVAIGFLTVLRRLRSLSVRRVPAAAPAS